MCLFSYNISAGVRVTILFDLYRVPLLGECELFDNKMKCDYPVVPPATSSLGVPTEVMTEKVRGGIDALLSGGRPAVAVCLSHRYPLCQASRDFLKGGDRALYDFLCRHYSVEISAIVIESLRHLEYHDVDKVSAGRFVEETGDDEKKLAAAGNNNTATDDEKDAAAAQEKVMLMIPILQWARTLSTKWATPNTPGMKHRMKS
jgi:hypothetical protein